MVNRVENLGGGAKEVLSRSENLRAKTGEFLFGKTSGEALRMVGFYGLIMIIGTFAKDPGVIIAGYVGMTISFKEFAVLEARTKDYQTAKSR